MIAHAGTPFRPDRRVLTGLAWRAALVVVAAIAVVLGLPAWLRAPLSVAAVLATALFFMQRYRRRGLLDAGLIAVGGGVVLLALLGLLLNAIPVGLSRTGWALGGGAVQLGLLVGLAFLRPVVRARTTAAGPAIGRRSVVAVVGWSAAIAGVLAAAVMLSAVSFGATHVAPLAVEAETGHDSIVVTLTSGTAQGPFRLDLVTDAGRIVLASGVRVGPGAPASTTVRLPAGTRGLVQVVRAGTSTPVRELIVDSTQETGS